MHLLFFLSLVFLDLSKEVLEIRLGKVDFENELSLSLFITQVFKVLIKYFSKWMASSVATLIKGIILYS